MTAAHGCGPGRSPRVSCRFCFDQLPPPVADACPGALFTLPSTPAGTTSSPVGDLTPTRTTTTLKGLPTTRRATILAARFNAPESPALK